MNKITPCLWFDDQAEDAVGYYTAIFRNSKTLDITRYGDAAAGVSGQPKGSVMTLVFRLDGHEFLALNGGPQFKFNPSVSFILNFDTSRDKDAREYLDTVWNELIREGTALMPLQEYPFSKRYGWVQDRYGLSWQLILSDPEGEERPFIVPSLMFTGGMAGRAEEAIDFYTSVFPNSKRGTVARYGPDQAPDKEGTVMFADFMALGTWFAAMDSAYEHGFAFNEAISFMVHCDSQEEIDRYWGKLSAVPQAEACGWLKDKFGLSWQIVPTALGALLQDRDPVKSEKVVKEMLQMKKLDIRKLEMAHKQ